MPGTRLPRSRSPRPVTPRPGCATAGSWLRQPVPAPVHGLHVPRLGRISFDLAAEVHDMRVDRALEHVLVEAERLLDDLRAGEDPPRFRGERLEDAELLGGERDRPALDAYLEPRRIDLQVTHDNRRPGRWGTLAGPAQ